MIPKKILINGILTDANVPESLIIAEAKKEVLDELENWLKRYEYKQKGETFILVETITKKIKEFRDCTGKAK